MVFSVSYNPFNRALNYPCTLACETKKAVLIWDCCLFTPKEQATYLFNSATVTTQQVISQEE